MKLILAADHGGKAAKDEIAIWLHSQGYDIFDAGAHILDPADDFPDFVAAALTRWRQDQTARLILWCKSGAGVCIAANRLPGIYCNLALSPDQVAAATADDQLNALALAANYMDISVQKSCIDVFLHTKKNEAARFTRRLAKVDNLCKSSRPF